MEAPTHNRPRVTALMNQKGGVGKTTTAVSLAAAAAESGRRVLLIDIDPQAHASLHLGIDPGGVDHSIYTLLLDPDSLPDEAVVEVAERLSVLPSETDLAAAETELASASARHHRLSRIIHRLAPRFDLVLVDCPPSLGLLTINALAAADEILIPMQAHFLALQGVSKLLETVRLMTASINPTLTVRGVVLCMHDVQTTHTQEVVADLDAFFENQRGSGLPWADAVVFRPHVRRNIKLAESPSFGQSIFQYAPDAAGARDYRQLAAAIFRPGTDADPAADSAREIKPSGAERSPEITVVSPDAPEVVD